MLGRANCLEHTETERGSHGCFEVVCVQPRFPPTSLPWFNRQDAFAVFMLKNKKIHLKMPVKGMLVFR